MYGPKKAIYATTVPISYGEGNPLELFVSIQLGRFSCQQMLFRKSVMSKWFVHPLFATLSECRDYELNRNQGWIHLFSTLDALIQQCAFIVGRLRPFKWATY